MRIKERESENGSPVQENSENQEQDQDLDADSDNGVPIYSSLESLLFLPQGMSKELSQKALETQALLDRWSNNRRGMSKKLNIISNSLDNWEKGCAISTAIGSSVGIASSCAVIGSLFIAPPMAVAGFVVGTMAGASNLITGLAKMKFWKNKIADSTAMCEEDTKLFGELMESRKDLLAMVQRIIDSEDYHKNFGDNTDYLNNITNVLGCGAIGAAGLGARYTAVQLGRLSSNFVKGILHSAAAIGIVLDSVSLVLSAKNLIDDEKSKLGEDLRELAGKLELDRQKVCRDFLNHDVWNEGEEEDGETEQGDEARTLETLSDIGSFENMSRLPLSPNEQMM